MIARASRLAVPVLPERLVRLVDHLVGLVAELHQLAPGTVLRGVRLDLVTSQVAHLAHYSMAVEGSHHVVQQSQSHADPVRDQLRGEACLGLLAWGEASTKP